MSGEVTVNDINKLIPVCSRKSFSSKAECGDVAAAAQ
jgi:hypothetical protein